MAAGKSSKGNKRKKARAEAKPESSKQRKRRPVAKKAAEATAKTPKAVAEPVRHASRPRLKKRREEPLANKPPWTIILNPIPRIHILAATLLCLLLAFHAIGNIALVPELKDSRTNFEVGIIFGETGVLAPSEKLRGWHTREPFVPFLIGGYHQLRKFTGLPTVPRLCLSPSAQETRPCQLLTAPYRLINALFLALSAVCAFVLVYWSVGNAIPAYAAYALTGSSFMLSTGLQRFVTEAPAAGLITLVAVFLYALLADRKWWVAFGLGASLAALALTKVIFAYFWAIIAAGLLVLALVDRKSRPRLVAMTGIMIIGYAVIVGGWVTRNYVYGGGLDIVEGRSYRVLSVRASYNKMRMDEFWTGFVLLLPFMTPKDVQRMGYPPSSFERFNTNNPMGFRKLGQRAYKTALAEETQKAIAAHVPRPVQSYVYAVLERKFRDEILADPLAHLRTTILFAATRNFPEHGFGTASRNRRLAAAWGSTNWPRFGYRFSVGEKLWFNASTTLSIIMVPFVIWWRQRNLAGFIIALPIFYSHALYAGISHFNPRYAIPEIPLRNVALCVVVFVAVAVLLRQVWRLELIRFVSFEIHRKQKPVAVWLERQASRWNTSLQKAQAFSSLRVWSLPSLWHR